MRTYFIPHTAELLVREEDIRTSWDEKRIAVHYPPRGEIEYSLNIDDHKRGDRNVINRFLSRANATRRSELLSHLGRQLGSHVRRARTHATTH